MSAFLPGGTVALKRHLSTRNGQRFEAGEKMHIVGVDRNRLDLKDARGGRLFNVHPNDVTLVAPPVTPASFTPDRVAQMREALKRERAENKEFFPQEPVMERLFAIDDLVRNCRLGVATKDVLRSLHDEFYPDWDGGAHGADASYRKARRDLETLFKFRAYDVKIEEGGEKRYFFRRG